MSYNYKKIAKDKVKESIRLMGNQLVSELTKRLEVEENEDGLIRVKSTVMLCEYYSKNKLRDFHNQEQLKKKLLGK